MKKISIQDIAKDLGLSRNTVSKALCNSESVSYVTRQKIIKRAVEMGYKKLNPELKVELDEPEKVRTGNVAVLAHREIADFWNRIVLGISSELSKNKFNLLFNFINEEDEDNLLLPPNIVNHGVDGLILLSVFKNDYINKILDMNIPVVFLDCPLNGFDYEFNGDILLVEGENSVYEITKDLIQKGRKRLGFIGDITYCRTVYDRWRGFTEALNEAGMTVDKDVCLTGGLPGRYYIFEELYKSLQGIKNLPDAFVCANDDIAFNVIAFLKERDYKVPEQIAVTGFDDMRDSILIEPSLTTVHVSNEQLGKRLVQELFWRIDNPDMPYEVLTINSKVIFRKSSGV